MKMTVRACVLASVLLLVGASSVFAQATLIAGAPAGSIYAGAGSFGFPVNREGIRELFAPVSLCTTGAGAGVGTSPFLTGDVYRIRYYGNVSAVTSPNIAGGALAVGTQVAAFQTAAPAGTLGVSAVGQIDTIAGIGGNPATTVSSVYVTVTSGLAAGNGGYPACITVQSLRFDVANTVIQPTAAVPTTTPVVLASNFEAIADQTAAAGAALVPVTPIPSAAPPASVITTGQFPAVGTACPATAVVLAGQGGCFVGMSGATLAAAGVAGVNSGTGAVVRRSGGANFAPVPAVPNPLYNLAGTLAASTVPQLQQNSGSTSTATISVAQAAAPLAIGLTLLPAVSSAAGGGMLRSSGTGSNAAAVPFLIQSGASTGTQVTLTVGGMPAGSSVTFGNDASAVNAVGTELMHMSIVGSGTLTANGTVTYVVTNNVTGGVATSIDLPYTVTEAATGAGFGAATVSISVAPASGVPSYVLANGATGITVIPSPTTVAANFAASFILYNIALSTSVRTYPYVSVFGTGLSKQDTGLVLCNTGGAFAGTTFTPSAPNGSQQGTFKIDMFPYSASTPALPITITSDALKTANGGLSAGGVLAPGGCWVTLFSQLLTDMGVTPGSGGVSGYMRITTNWNATSTGFTYISQFATANGTMGYVAQ